MADLNIDLSGFEHKWSKSGRQICAVCGFDFDFQDDPDPDAGYEVPLLLWRNQNKEMLTLCWDCARIYMQRKEGN